jgi:hypothetical protein
MRPVAADPPILDSVTLVAVTSVAIGPTIEALRSSMRQARFGRVLLLSDRPPRDEATGIEWRRIEPLRSRSDYSRFMLRNLADHVETPHALCVQWDGFVLDGAAWEPGFLDYDYIGAPWPHFADRHTVGNGGFSLRSRALLRSSKELPVGGSQSEDVLICRQYRPELEARGLCFAPEPVARRFAYERMPPTGAEFGFHGAFNLVRMLPRARVLSLFRSLEPNVLARSERLELLRWALANGRPGVAIEMARRLF